MIFQKLPKGRALQVIHSHMNKDVEALLVHDWSDDLFDEWCSSREDNLSFGTRIVEEKKVSYCELVKKICT